MRLFVAALPDPAIVQYLLQVYGGWPRPEIDGLRWTGPDQWHVTLRFLGLADPIAAAVALDQLGTVAAKARLGPTTALFGRGILMVPVVGVDSLAGAVAAATPGVGETPENRPFAGHLTLARSRGRIPAELVDVPVAGVFPVTEVCLMQSETLPEGARYEVLRRWPLRS
ncbi:MAG: hypothetical protein VX833_08740 [Actinomycetota bacterium]|nr:hypothetical protein [Actinomycetota bacterium]